LPHAQIEISMRGYVRDVFRSIENVKVVLVDWDVDPSDPTPDVVDIVDAGRTRLALVGSFAALPFADLSGRDVAAAVLEYHRRPCAETVPA
jgi:hypothetical protein